MCDHVWVAERAENLVSRHLRTLRAAGIAESRRDGKMVRYALPATGRALLDAVVADEVPSWAPASNCRCCSGVPT